MFSQKKAFLMFSQKKAFLMFSQKKDFFIFSEMEPCTFQPTLKKQKIIHPKKISYTWGNENPKKFVIFFQKKAVLMFQEMETLKNLLIFQEVTYIAWK